MHQYVNLKTSSRALEEREEMVEEGDVQALVELGLTNRQARVFLELLRYEASTAKTLSLASSLARQDTYNVLDELQKLGLVTKLISSPTKFGAIPIKDALSILLNRKIEQASDLEIRTRKLIKKHESQKTKIHEKKEQKILFISGREAFILTLRKAMRNSQKSIDIASSGNRLQGIISLIEDLEEAVSRGVKIRCLTDTGVDKETQKAFDILRGTLFFEVRKMTNQSWARFYIYDKKELSMIISPSEDFCRPTLLLSNCPSMVDAYMDHYETMWLNANYFGKWKNSSEKLPLPSIQGN
jgi:sugar-specific transcriptional regulator TrmB